MALPDTHPDNAPTAADDAESGLPTPHCVVGIGAAEGGWQPLRQFFEAMPADSGQSFVVIVPALVEYARLHERLAAHTAMPVVEVSAAVAVEPDRVYVPPPGTRLNIAQGELRPVPVEAAAGDGPDEDESRAARPYPPLDHFFRGLADALGERAMCVVLAGSGSDGTVGLRAVEAAGGLTLVQLPQTAAHDGMPCSALRTGVADYVLAVERMPEALLDYARHSYVRGGETGAGRAQQDLNTVLALVRAYTGHHFGHYKKQTLLRRVQRRMGLKHSRSGEDYIRLLREQPTEVNALVKDFMIGVTEFYRDPPAWQALEREVIALLIAGRETGRPVRVWTAGCSTGEEAYSVAMLLLEQLQASPRHGLVQVFATDINPAALATARSGLYPASAVSQLPPARQRRFFTEVQSDHHYQINKVVRDAVVFAEQNLLADPPFSKLDLITCRNLLIYLEPDVQKKLLALFHFALREGGCLFLGSAEGVGQGEDLFQPLSQKHRIYRRVGQVRRIGVNLPIVPSSEVTHETPAVPTERVRQARLADLARQTLLEDFGPAAVLINRKLEVLYYSGPTHEYLAQPGGTPTHDLLTLVSAGCHLPLRNLVRRAMDEGRAQSQGDVRLTRDDTYQLVRITVSPVRGAGQAEGLYLVVFQEQAAAPQALDAVVDGAESALLRQLEFDLKATREDLQAHIEEVETTNEELQSTNEELETSKEELQSLNEELLTVNQQLQTKMQETESTNDDLNNLLSSTEIATLFLDAQLRIKRYTPAMQRLLKLIATDVGRPISDFAHRLADAGLAEDICQVLETFNPVEREVEAEDGRTYIRRVLPYRTAESRVDGVVATFTDVTPIKQQAQQLARFNERLEREVAERTGELEARGQQLRALSHEVLLIQDRERRQLACDLHDNLGQILALTRIRISQLRQDGADYDERLAPVDDLVRQANEAVRTLAFEASPPVLHALGLLAGLQWLAESVEGRYGLHVDVSGEEPPALDENLRALLFRAVRELLINTARHAQTDRARVILGREDGELRLQVQDRGVGFQSGTGADDAPQHSFGLPSVIEHIDIIGGRVDIDARPGEGVTVNIAVPLTGMESAPPAPRD